MRVILVKDVSGIGRAGDIKEVSDGYARNFLMPKKLAMLATIAETDRIAKEKREKQEKLAREQEKLERSKKILEAKLFTIKAKADGRHLFAAIHEADIAKLVSERIGTELDPKRIRLPKAIKELGSHKVTIKLSEKLEAIINLNVEQQ